MSRSMLALDEIFPTGNKPRKPLHCRASVACESCRRRKVRCEFYLDDANRCLKCIKFNTKCKIYRIKHKSDMPPSQSISTKSNSAVQPAISVSTSSRNLFSVSESINPLVLGMDKQASEPPLSPYFLPTGLGSYTQPASNRAEDLMAGPTKYDEFSCSGHAGARLETYDFDTTQGQSMAKVNLQTPLESTYARPSREHSKDSGDYVTNQFLDSNLDQRFTKTAESHYTPCTKNTGLSPSLNPHMPSKRPHECTFCSQGFSTADEYRSHLYEHLTAVPEDYHCEYVPWEKMKKYLQLTKDLTTIDWLVAKTCKDHEDDLKARVSTFK